LGNSFLYRVDPGDATGLPEEYVGRGRAETEAVFQRADLLLNFHYAIAPPLLALFKRAAVGGH